MDFRLILALPRNRHDYFLQHQQQVTTTHGSLPSSVTTLEPPPSTKRQILLSHTPSVETQKMPPMSSNLLMMQRRKRMAGDTFKRSNNTTGGQKQQKIQFAERLTNTPTQMHDAHNHDIITYHPLPVILPVVLHCARLLDKHARQTCSAKNNNSIHAQPAISHKGTIIM